MALLRNILYISLIPVFHSDQAVPETPTLGDREEKDISYSLAAIGSSVFALTAAVLTIMYLRYVNFSVLPLYNAPHSTLLKHAGNGSLERLVWCSITCLAIGSAICPAHQIPLLNKILLLRSRAVMLKCIWQIVKNRINLL